MKLTWPKLKRNANPERRWPGYLFGGYVRTSTVALIVAFLLVWWAYDAYRPEPGPEQTPQVVPPGFIPDPNYTWVPRTRLQKPPVTVTETVTPTPTTTETTTPTGEPGFPSPPLFPFPPPPAGPPPPFTLPPPFPPTPTPKPGQGAPPPGAPTLPAPQPVAPSPPPAP